VEARVARPSFDRDCGVAAEFGLVRTSKKNFPAIIDCLVSTLKRKMLTLG
jgi:hypothetical protein